MSIIIPAVEPAFYRDAFGKTRVSNPQTLFDASFTHDEQELLFDEKLVLAGTITRNAGSYLVMDITAQTGDRVVKQSKRYVNYQPGKSLQWLMTGVLETSGGAAGIVARIGVYDNDGDKTVDSGGDGTFFMLNATTLYVVMKSYVTGSNVETQVAQSAWNGDRLDGSGGSTNPSGITLDPSKTNIYCADIEWLGVGSIRYFIVINGIPYLVHTIHHANLTLETPYMRKATLPVRWEIENLTGANTGEMIAVCCTVISEGGFNPRGKTFSADSDSSPVSVGGTELPILSLKLKDASNRVTLNPVDIGVFASETGEYLFKVWIGTSLTGASWTSVNAGSAAEYDLTATAVTTTNAVCIKSGYFSSTKDASITDFENTLLVVANIAGTSDIMTVTAERVDGGAAKDIYADFQWQEWE